MEDTIYIIPASHVAVKYITEIDAENDTQQG